MFAPSGAEYFKEAFVWTPSAGLSGLQMLGGHSFSEATDVSGDGSVIVGSSKGSLDEEACLWTANGNVIGLGHLGNPRSPISRAFAVSADGKVVVGEYLDRGPIAFRWDAASGMISLGDFPGGLLQSGAYDVSADGSVLVGYGISGAGNGNLEAFRWTASEGMVGLGDLPGGQILSSANAVSPDGRVIVGVGSSSDDQRELEAFRWTPADGMLGLGDLPGGFAASAANAVSADGTVIVGYGTTDTTATSLEAIIWDPTHGMLAISKVLASAGVILSGWNLYEATDISADGTIVVGNGINPAGNEEAWIAVLADEEPPSILQAAASPAVLWPPNHKMVSVQVNALVHDDSGKATWKVIAARSNEPGSDAKDIQIVSDTNVNLRASRRGNGPGRVYTIELQAADAAGNLSEIKSVAVYIPHDSRTR